MSTEPRYYWHSTWRWGNGAGLPPGEDLAAFRSGLGKPAMSVPGMWPFYASPAHDDLARLGKVTVEQEAEHAALALFGLHQQSQRTLMHRAGSAAWLGAAVLGLRRSGKFSEQAVDARMNALATSTTVPALLHRLRGIVTQLRTVGQPLDYDRLLLDIKDWHYSESRQRVRRRWALGYRSWEQAGDHPDEP
ncbi:type I-E CRISPR-associated protein Cse2/CasB [Streptomyces sp. URMC 129]|uniref:type I-E CRISPR-associated protein Cse2/CasB n=1 Tax=Streptomyces sp. URMC 129 TaxID=3423407 RepID=UPI003F1C12E6